ncbi:diguanylate cyclase [Ruminococcus sp. RTP21484sp1_RTP31023st1_H8_RTP31023_210422]|uniref:diguanylate cyclase domain-containing protein n=1 Tax=Ruminococcus sp. RTP21484sp1_RTP31023st1_H8_RTP31023_210422 TaxID=3141611 RepID=UPI0034A27C05
MERNKTIMKLCYLQTTFYIVFLTALITRHRRGISQKTFAFLIILSLVGCAVSLTLGDYIRNMIRSSGFDVAGVHDKKSLEKKLQQLQNADDTLNVGVMMFDLNNLKKINDTYGHEQGDVFIQTFASYLTRILTEDSFLARFGGDEFVIVQNHATWSQLEQMNIQLQSMLDVYNQTADHPISYAVGYDISCKNHYYLIMDLLQIADQKMYQDKRYKKEQMAKKPQEFCRNPLAESISTESLKEKLFTILNNSNGEKKYAFLMTDVSNFHLINDYWGYETGTNILNFILKKMELFPQTLFVNRYHSDIFVAVIDITGEEHTAVKNRIIESNKQTTKEVLAAYPVNYLSLNTGIYYLENMEIPGEEIISHSNIVRIKAKDKLCGVRIYKRNCSC